MSNKKHNYVKQSKIKSLERSHEWIILLGERSNGKSYAVKSHAVQRAIDTGGQEEFIYLRRYELDTKDSLCVSYFADLPIYEMTNGMYDCIDVYRKGIYLCNIDSETGKVTNRKRIGYCHSLSTHERYKSLMFPKVERIIYEEFISADGRYIFNESDVIEQYCSTIFRNNKKGHVFLIGNKISRICPYFRKWELTGILKQKDGTVDEYVFKNENGDDTRLCVYMTDSLNYNSGMFFGNVAKNITSAGYEVNEHPHLPEPISCYNKIYQCVVYHDEFYFLCSFLKHREKSDRFTWYIEPKTKHNIKKGTRVISSDYSDNILWTQSFNPLTKEEQFIFSFLDDGKICYSDNLTGTEFQNVLNNYL